MAQDAGLGVYVHWPFCAAKCPYCDFNSHVRHEPVDQMRFAAALVAEIDHFAARLPGRRVETVFFGGGTPSLMAPATVEAVLDAIARAWVLAADAEITLEANPASGGAERFRGFRAGGVNRVSRGVQALNDADLKALGRLHSVAEARAALDIARSTFSRVSFDLIYARSGQTLEAWGGELRQALAMEAGHMSLYQLTIEPGTPFHALHAAGRLTVPDDDRAADMFALTQEMCAAAGLPAYETSNHARPGEESRDNLIYWRMGDYVGIGPGAHGRFFEEGARRATVTLRQPERWRDQVDAMGHGIETETRISAAEQADEMLLMGLRLAEGIDMRRHEALAGAPLDGAALSDLRDLGLVSTRGDQLTVTPKGRPVLNSVIAALSA